ncbi:DUF6701 domain-containing protein [Idiomarina aminovorans]|uniref:DUF6701 domain-containing protein n=1 Tax=Idiomarina aminovorans TaxID=2914829 RepID=UPI002006A0B9|nr:DUF6701 domain-containing protein [Idiomarina sp. ATCH4]MCK7458971.1 polymer-forming cytoskeletal protein [Idiomarina sp. ATCH4]
MSRLNITLAIFLTFLAVSSECVAETFKIPPPGNSGQQTFPDCAFNQSTNTYVCSEDLEFDNNDVIELRGNPSLPITFDVAGKISFGNNVRVNNGGSPGDLIFDAEEGFEVGNDSVLVGTINGATDVDLGSRVQGVGNIINVNNIDIDNGSEIDGRLEATGAIELGDRVTIGGDINAGGDFDAGNGVNVGGNIDSSGETSAGEDFILGGSIFSGDTLELGNRADISGNIGAQNSIEIGEDSSLKGSLTTFGADEEIDLGNRTTVTGNINSSGDFEVGEDSTITGNVTVDGEVDVENRTTVEGSLDAGDEVEVGEDVSITGNINAKGPVELGNRSVVGGYVNAPNGDGDLGDGTVNGPTCDQNNNVGGCSGNTPNLAQCADVWPEASVYSGNSIPKPIELPEDENQNPLPQQLQPVDYLRVAPAGGFTDVGADYETNGQTSRVYIEGDLTIQEGRQINVSGSPDELILVVTGDLTIERNVAIRGYIYVGGSLFVQRGANGNNQIEIEGAISVSNESFYLSGPGSLTPPAIEYVAPEFPFNGGQFCSVASPQPPSPLLNWKLNDGPWNNSPAQVIDSSGNSFDGTSSSVEWSSNTPAIPTNLSGEGTCGYGEFDYTQSHTIQIADDVNGLNDQLDFGPGEEFTIGLWIKPKSFNPSSNLMTIASKDTNYEFHVRNNGSINWWWNTGSGNTRQFDSSTVVNVGGWQYVAIRYKDGEQSITIIDDQFNTVSKTTETYGGGLTTNDRPFILGNDFNQTRYFDGDMDELSVFNESLTDSQLLAVAQQTTLCETSGPVCLLPDLDETSFSADWAVIESGNTVPGIINSGSPSPRLRLTENAQNQTTAITLKQPVAAAGSKVEVTFRLYAYDGSGADGIALVLSDKIPVNAGQFGGSLGYANSNSNSGFDGGWLGIGFDAYGNFANATEDRNGGIGRTPDSVTLRGAEDAAAGRQEYQFIGTSGTLGTGIDDASANTPKPGHLYKVVIDNTDTSAVSVEVLRDISGQGNNYISLYQNNDISNLQPAIPNEFYISFAGSTGGSTNIHEFDSFQVCSSDDIQSESINHYRLSFPSSAVSCVGAKISGVACADANCGIYNQPASATFELQQGGAESGSAIWTSKTANLDSTVKNTTVKDNAGIYSVALTGKSPSAPTRCFVDGVETASCELELKQAGFIFNDPASSEGLNEIGRKVSGEDYSDEDIDEKVFVRAVTTDDNQLTCSDFTENLSNLQLSFQCVNPSSCPSANDTNLGFYVKDDENASFTQITNTPAPVPINFEGSEAGFYMTYGDAGAVSITAGAEYADGLSLTGTSDPFVWTPDNIKISAETAADGDGVPYENGILAKAGQNFTVKLQPLNANGDQTPNFGNETTVSYELELEENRHTTADPNRGEVTGESSFNKPDINVPEFISNSITYDEVGAVKLVAEVKGKQYLPQYHPSDGFFAGEQTIGRFIPDRFVMYDNEFANVCGGSMGDPFYYIGQPQELAGYFEAQNVAGDLTKNYDGTRAPGDVKLMYKGFGGLSSSLQDEQPPLSDVLSFELNWNNGVGEFADPANVVYPRASSYDETELYDFEGPIEDYQLGVQIDDGEGGNYYSVIEGASLSSTGGFNYAVFDEADLLFGRLRLKNLIGAAVDPLPVKAVIEYWDGSSFVVNERDSCFDFEQNALSVTTTTNLEGVPIASTPNLAASPASKSLTKGSLVAVNASTAINDLIRWEGLTDQSKFEFEYDLSNVKYLRFDWLGDGNLDGNLDDAPQAEALIGIYRGSDRQIYWQEVGW